MGYFVFMQEKRRTEEGWERKTNTELQTLCDPLWRALSREEKNEYKSQGKKAKRLDLDLHVKERQRQERFVEELDVKSLELARHQLVFMKKKTKVVLLEMITPGTVYVAPEKELGRVEKFLQKCPRNKIDKFFVRAGVVGFTRFSEDGKMYRCQVLSSNMKKVK